MEVDDVRDMVEAEGNVDEDSKDVEDLDGALGLVDLVVVVVALVDKTRTDMGKLDSVQAEDEDMEENEDRVGSAGVQLVRGASCDLDQWPCVPEPDRIQSVSFQSPSIHHPRCLKVPHRWHYLLAAHKIAFHQHLIPTRRQKLDYIFLIQIREHRA